MCEQDETLFSAMFQVGVNECMCTIVLISWVDQMAED